jgi:prepilin-type N-terminal cleavage/methylation domain-containing protein
MKKTRKAFTMVELVVTLALASVLLAGVSAFVVYVTRMQGYLEKKDKSFSNANEFRLILTAAIDGKQEKSLTVNTSRHDTAENIRTAGYVTTVFSYSEEGITKSYFYDPTAGSYGFNNGTTSTDTYKTDIPYLMTITKDAASSLVTFTLQDTDYVSLLTFDIVIDHLVSA